MESKYKRSKCKQFTLYGDVIVLSTFYICFQVCDRYKPDERFVTTNTMYKHTNRFHDNLALAETPEIVNRLNEILS